MVLFLFSVISKLNAQQLPTRLGDLDADGQITVIDLQLLLNHLGGKDGFHLVPDLLPFADVNEDGYFNQADVTMLRDAILGIPIPVNTWPVSLEPVTGSSEVGVTVRPKASFPRPIDIATLNSNNFYATFAGRRLDATIAPANNGTFAWLFFHEPMPNASLVQVTVDGSTIRTRTGLPLDADGDGTFGGVMSFNFSTVSITAIPGTVLSSRIVDPGPDLIPRTADDVTFGAGYNYLLPIQGVKVYVLGLENNVAYTDANGRVTLTNMPVGDVKVVLDGRTATNQPAGYYFPEMVMDATFAPGITNGVMTARDADGNEVRDGNGVPIQAFAMYLPRVASNVLQTISASLTNLITLQSNAAYNLPPAQQPYLTLEIMPNSLIGMDGHPLSSAQVGVSVVPPELVREMLPPGLLQHTFDITVQAPGIATFATPAPMTFPNVFNAPPGTKLNFLSFDHTTGLLVIEGTATVSADGLSVHTDPGTGITHPGWHGLTPPGSNGRGGGGGPRPPKPPKNCDTLRNLAISAEIQCAAEIALSIPEFVPVVGCAVSFGAGVAGSTADCIIDFGTCEKTIAENTVGTLIGCIPFGIGSIGGITYSCAYQAGSAVYDYDQCVRGNALQAATTGLAAAIPKNIWFEQAELWAAAANVGALVFGNAKWTQVDPAELKQVNDFFRAVNDAIQPTTADGKRFATSERDAILLLPLPSNLTSADAQALLTRLDQMMGGVLPPAEFDAAAIAAAGSALLEIATELQSRGWVTTYDAYLRGLPQLVKEQDQALGTNSVLAAPLFYKVTNLRDGFVQRDRLGTQGTFDQLFLAANTFYTIHYLDPTTLRVGVTAFLTGPSGSSYTIPRAVLVDASPPDTDGDGLADEAEAIIGTDPTKISTCGDGISDLARMQQDLALSNCLPLPTGIIAALPLPGETKEVVLVGSTTDAAEQTAYVACGSRGLSIVNASKFQMPILLGQLDLAGDATDVAVDSNLKIAAVAANAGGLHLVDVSDPTQPKLLRTITNVANQVESVDGIVYAAIGSALNSYDLLTGERLQALPLGGGDLPGLSREGSFLYTMDNNHVLRAIDIREPVMVARGSLTMPDDGVKLFAGNGIAYIGAESVFPGGFATANVSNPDSLMLLSSVDSTSIAGKAIAANGSGLAITIGSPGMFGNLIEVLNVTDPSNTGAFITQFRLPADPFNIAIASGIAFVANGTAGLQIVNYRPFDNQGVAPVVSINTPSTNAVEGSFLPIQFQVSDDVQVRRVELIVNGQVAQNDVSFPFDLTAALPLLAGGSSNVVVQVRATDTGGNIGLSNPITIQLVADGIPPAVLRINPADNASRSPGFRAVTIDFSESLDKTTVTAQNIQLLGTNGVVSPQNIQFRVNGAEVQLTYPVLAEGDYQIIIHGAAMKDRAGNALGSTNIVSHFTIGTVRSVAWINPGGGFWDDPSNWEGGMIPGPSQDALIAVPGNVAVTYRQGTNSIHSLVSSNAFKMTGGQLTVATTIRFEDRFELFEGRIVGATISTGTGGKMIVTNIFGSTPQKILDGVTLAGDLKVYQTTLTVMNGLTLEGAKLTLESAVGFAHIVFRGTQTLGGTGEVVFVGTFGGSDIRPLGDGTPAGANTLTIGPGILIHGTRGGTMLISNFDTIINQGTIFAGTTNEEMQVFTGVTGVKFINQGMMRAATGGVFRVRGMINEGIVTSTGGGTLYLEGVQSSAGTWTNMATIAATNSTLAIRGGWANSGTISVVNSAVSMEGSFTTAGLGTFNRTGGTVTLIGKLDNTGDAFTLDATTGSWALQGGTIKGGTLTASGGATFVMTGFGSGTFDGVNLNMPLTVPGQATLTIKNGLTMNGLPLTFEGGVGTATVIFSGTQTLGGTGEVVFAGTAAAGNILNVQGLGTQVGAATLTIGPNITIHGSRNGALRGNSFDTIVNQGVITADTTNQTITLGQANATVINQGTVRALYPGKLAMAGSNINSAQLTPGNPPQLLNITGTFTQQVAGVVNVHIGGTTPGTGFSQLKATGSVGLDGTLNLTLINGYEPNLGDTFEIMTFPSITGQFATINGTNISSAKAFQAVYTTTNLTLKVVPP